MHILRPKQFYFAFMSHLLFARYIFQPRHLQAYYKRGLRVVWRKHVPTGNRYVVRCGRSHSTDNYYRSRLFSGFIQIQKRYPTSLDKMRILT